MPFQNLTLELVKIWYLKSYKKFIAKSAIFST